MKVWRKDLILAFWNGMSGGHTEDESMQGKRKTSPISLAGSEAASKGWSSSHRHKCLINEKAAHSSQDHSHSHQKHTVAWWSILFQGSAHLLCPGGGMGFGSGSPGAQKAQKPHAEHCSRSCRSSCARSWRDSFWIFSGTSTSLCPMRMGQTCQACFI